MILSRIHVHCLLAMATLAVSASTLLAQAPANAQSDPRDDANPFGISSSSEWSGEFPKFTPLLEQTGAGWIRFWPEWNGIEPKHGQFSWNWTDKLVSTARENHMKIAGVLAYFAPWASSAPDGTKDYGKATRTFPVREPKYWKEYVAANVTRYHNDVKYWEVWNEVNSPTFNHEGTIEDYADMVKWTYDSARQVDPTTKIGIGVANFAVSYLDRTIKSGAADHFNYLCVHPYENEDSLLYTDGEVSFLSMAGSLRAMLAANKQRTDIQLWMTEVGWQAPIAPNPAKEALQSEMLVKTYVLGIAQGFTKICWFEARGPAYGKGTDHGLIRADWTLRPSYHALRTMISTLGQQPRYSGWLNLDGSYGFVFHNPTGAVLTAWTPVGQQQSISFDSAVHVVDLTGKNTELPPGEKLTLTNTPVFIVNPPASLTQKAQSNLDKPFPWGGDYSKASQVSLTFDPKGDEKGIKSTEPNGARPTNPEGEAYRLVDGKKVHEVQFRVNPTFAPYGTTNLTIKVLARRDQADQTASLNMRYESTAGRHGYSQVGTWTIPADNQWHEQTWTVTDANFVGTWGYNIALCEINGKVQIKQLTVQKTAK